MTASLRDRMSFDMLSENITVLAFGMNAPESLVLSVLRLVLRILVLDLQHLSGMVSDTMSTFVTAMGAPDVVL